MAPSWLGPMATAISWTAPARNAIVIGCSGSAASVTQTRIQRGPAAGGASGSEPPFASASSGSAVGGPLGAAISGGGAAISMSLMSSVGGTSSGAVGSSPAGVSGGSAVSAQLAAAPMKRATVCGSLAISSASRSSSCERGARQVTHAIWLRVRSSFSSCPAPRFEQSLDVGRVAGAEGARQQDGVVARLPLVAPAAELEEPDTSSESKWLRSSSWACFR